MFEGTDRLQHVHYQYLVECSEWFGAPEAAAFRDRAWSYFRELDAAIADIVAWAGEEPRFGTGCVGSRCAAGELSRADLDRLADRAQITMAAALRAAGFDPDRVAEAAIDPATVHALVELHIEQAIVLETHGEPIGVVEAIAAPHDFRLTFTGAAAHAGRAASAASTAACTSAGPAWWKRASTCP